MNKGILAIGGLAGIGLLKRFGSFGSTNVDLDNLVRDVCRKLSTVVELSKNPNDNENMIRDVILSFQNEAHFSNMVQNLSVSRLSEHNNIFYYEMNKDSFRELVRNYLKSISMWFESDFVDLGPVDFQVKKSWFSNKGSKRISLMENSLYKENFFYIYNVFKKLPPISNNKDFVEQATLTAKEYIKAYYNFFEHKDFFVQDRITSMYDNFTTFTPSIYNQVDGFDIIEYNPNNYPKTFNILDKSLTSAIPKVIANFNVHKPLWNNILSTDYSQIDLPIWMPPYELHYLFMNASVNDIFFRTRIQPAKLWSQKRDK